LQLLSDFFRNDTVVLANARRINFRLPAGEGIGAHPQADPRISVEWGTGTGRYTNVREFLISYTACLIGCPRSEINVTWGGHMPDAVWSDTLLQAINMDEFGNLTPQYGQAYAGTVHISAQLLRARNCSRLFSAWRYRCKCRQSDQAYPPPVSRLAPTTSIDLLQHSQADRTPLLHSKSILT